MREMSAMASAITLHLEGCHFLPSVTVKSNYLIFLPCGADISTVDNLRVTRNSFYSVSNWNHVRSVSGPFKSYCTPHRRVCTPVRSNCNPLRPVSSDENTSRIYTFACGRDSDSFCAFKLSRNNFSASSDVTSRRKVRAVSASTGNDENDMKKRDIANHKVENLSPAYPSECQERALRISAESVFESLGAAEFFSPTPSPPLPPLYAPATSSPLPPSSSIFPSTSARLENPAKNAQTVLRLNDSFSGISAKGPSTSSKNNTSSSLLSEANASETGTSPETSISSEINTSAGNETASSNRNPPANSKERESGNKSKTMATGNNDGGEQQWKNAFPAYMQSKEDKKSAKSWKDGNSGLEGGGMQKSSKAVNGFAVNSCDNSGSEKLGNGKGSSKETGSNVTNNNTKDLNMEDYNVKDQNMKGYNIKDYDMADENTVSFVTPATSAAQPPVTAGKKLPELFQKDPIWAAIRAEAKLEAEREPLLSSFLYASILAHSCFERSLGFVLANRLKNATLLATQLLEVFDDVIMQDSIRHAIRADVQAVKDRDPACRSYSSALLHFKGYHALQSHRIAHALWNRGQNVLALAMQSRISEVFAVDIHPAAKIGNGILLDHGTGVVIGETAVIGDRVSMLQGVTLGGTGKEAGDRHPKIHGGVLIGAGATILGNITVGKGAMVAAGSLVLKNVPPHSMVAGTPAKVVGMLEEKSPALSMKHDVAQKFCLQWEEAVRQQGLDSFTGGAGI